MAKGCCQCGAHYHDNHSPVTWGCVVRKLWVCRKCTLTIPGSNPVEYMDDTICSQACLLLREVFQS